MLLVWYILNVLLVWYILNVTGLIYSECYWFDIFSMLLVWYILNVLLVWYIHNVTGLIYSQCFTGLIYSQYYWFDIFSMLLLWMSFTYSAGILGITNEYPSLQISMTLVSFKWKMSTPYHSCWCGLVIITLTLPCCKDLQLKIESHKCAPRRIQHMSVPIIYTKPDLLSTRLLKYN